MTTATVVVPTARAGDNLRRALGGLARQTVPVEVIVADNATETAAADVAAAGSEARVLRFDENVGFGRAVNAAARQATGDALVLLNDDCTCDDSFVEEIVARLDPGRGIVMAAGVLRDPRAPDRIDTAGIDVDASLLVFDYLNGQPLSRLDADVADPIGPCGAAAAYDRAAYLEAGGFDEAFFAYWEDLDLALRLRLAGGSCALAARARGTHMHSATLGSGSAAKNYLVGFGRGYVLRRWSVLRTPRPALQALVGDAVICAGQAVADRNLAGVRGRVAGYRAAGRVERLAYPAGLLPAPGRPLGGSLLKRVRRRIRLRTEG